MDDRDSIRREVMAKLRREDRHNWRDWALYGLALAILGLDYLVYLYG